MKKPNDFSDTLSRSANEARAILQQTASLLEAEWKRIVDAVDESDNVPEQVKVAVDRFEGAVGDLREFVATNGPKVVSEGVRRARDAGVPIPEDWPSSDGAETADAGGEASEATAEGPFTDGSDAADDTAADVAEAELVDEDADSDKG